MVAWALKLTHSGQAWRVAQPQGGRPTGGRLSVGNRLVPPRRSGKFRPVAEVITEEGASPACEFYLQYRLWEGVEANTN